MYSRVFHATFFVFSVPFFAFHSILRQGRHLRDKSKNFVVYFFTALIKHEIRLKCEKCIAGLTNKPILFSNHLDWRTPRLRRTTPVSLNLCTVLLSPTILSGRHLLPLQFSLHSSFPTWYTVF